MEKNPITEWRQGRGISCTQIAVATGMARSSVYAVENGSATRLHPKLFALIASVEGEANAQRLQREWAAWLEAQRKLIAENIISS